MILNRRIKDWLADAAAARGYFITGSDQDWFPLIVNPVLRAWQKQVASVGYNYISSSITIARARAAGLTVPAYVAKKFGEEGAVERLIGHLDSRISLAQCKTVLEIGAGTGRFLEAILQQTRADTYLVYETNRNWSDYLKQMYAVTMCKADGVSLSPTADGTVDLAMAHGVFTYLPVTNSFSYFREMARVCAVGGYVVFDAYLDTDQGLEQVFTWCASGMDFHMVLPKAAIEQLFALNGFELVESHFRMPQWTSGQSAYMIFRKVRALPADQLVPQPVT